MAEKEPKEKKDLKDKKEPKEKPPPVVVRLEALEAKGKVK